MKPVAIERPQNESNRHGDKIMIGYWAEPATVRAIDASAEHQGISRSEWLAQAVGAKLSE